MQSVTTTNSKDILLFVNFRSNCFLNLGPHEPQVYETKLVHVCYQHEQLSRWNSVQRTFTVMFLFTNLDGALHARQKLYGFRTSKALTKWQPSFAFLRKFMVGQKAGFCSYKLIVTYEFSNKNAGSFAAPCCQ